MRTSRQLISIALLGGLAVVGSAGAQTQQTSDGSDYRPLQLNSPERPEVQRGAIEAARSHGGAGSESTGGSTAPAPTNAAATNSDEVRQGAMNAARSHGGAGSESTGSSTAPRPTRSGS